MELHIILFLMIAASIVAIETKDLISSVIALSAVGLGLSLAFLILKAPNLAITQLVVEIICVIILIRATINKDLPLVRDGRWVFNTTATALFIIVFLAFSYFALNYLPRFGEPVMRVSADYLANAVEKAGSENVVTAIALRFRSLDSLAEIGILFAAVIGVLTIARKVGRIDEK